MAKELETRIEEELLAGKSRAEILARLKATEEPRALLFHLNNISLPARRKKYQYLNLLLAAVLTFVTFKKLLGLFAFGRLDLFLLLSLVVPVVNLYLLREILRFHRIGYQFLFVLSILALLHPESHFLVEVALQLVLVALSGFLYFTIFPKSEQVAEITTP
ncbi:MAG: hypothetical protein AB1413_02850 [Thermodesulfobacteriota bacterium]